MFLVGRLIARLDVRLILASGLLLSAVSLWQMSHFALNMTPDLIVTSGFIQGVGMGLLFVPLTTVAFSTFEARWRTDAAAIYTLVRNIGASVGIAYMQALFIQKTAVHSALAENLTPDRPALAGTAVDLVTTRGVAAIDAELTRQASMVAYVNVFHLMMLVCLAAVPMLLFLRPGRPGAGRPVQAAVE